MCGKALKTRFIKSITHKKCLACLDPKGIIVRYGVASALKIMLQETRFIRESYIRLLTFPLMLFVEQDKCIITCVSAPISSVRTLRMSILS